MKRHFLSGARATALAACWLVGGVAAADGAAERAPLPQFDRVMLPPAPRPIRDFELLDQDGRRFRLSALRGRPVLVFFGFAHCPDICPATLQKLRMLRRSDDVELRKVPIVMISVDGSRDTPALMKDFLGRFSADFIGLTGEPRKVRDIAARFSAVFFKGSPRDAAGDYLVEHTSQVYAVDKAGLLRAEFYDATIEAIAGVTGALLQE